MCMQCGALIKAINAYLRKADNDLEETLGSEGYAKPEETVRAISAMEEIVAEALTQETEYIVTEAEKAGTLEEFSSNIWPEIKENDALQSTLCSTFRQQFGEIVPKFADYYLSDLEEGLKIVQVSKSTTAWIESWSRELAEIMQLNSHNEIETILTRGLEEGVGIAEFTRKIMTNGIRDEWYKARRVSVTEVLTAHRAAQQEAFMQSPATTEKMWRHTGIYIHGPRQNHKDMDGRKVPKDQPFELLGANGTFYHPMYPGDTSLPPGERIECHCISQGIVSEDVLGLSLEERQRLQQEAVAELDSEWEKKLEDRNQALAGYTGTAYSTKVTASYTSAATPGKGTITYGEGYTTGKHKQEIAVAEFLHDKFGGDIELLTEASDLGVKTADFRWGGKLWELKTATTEKSADSAVRGAFRQIRENPGGIILDYGSNKISIKKLKEILLSRFKRSGLSSLDIMLLTQDREVVNVYRYMHKK